MPVSQDHPLENARKLLRLSLRRLLAKVLCSLHWSAIYVFISMRIIPVPLQRGLKNRIQCIVLEFMGNLQDPICQLHVYLVDSGHKGRAFSVPSQSEIGVVSLYEMSQWLLPLKAPQKTTTTIAQDEPVTQEWRNNIVATAPHQQEPNLGSLIHLG